MLKASQQFRVRICGLLGESRGILDTNDDVHRGVRIRLLLSLDLRIILGCLDCFGWFGFKLCSL